MKTDSTHRAVLVYALFYVLLAALPASSAQAQSDAANEKKKLELREKELELKKKEVDLQRQQLQLDAARKDLQMQETDKNITMRLEGDVLFDFEKSALRPEAEKSLEKVAVVISQFPQSKVIINGYTDSRGDQQANLRLSEKRAEAVKAWLVKKGVAADAVSTKGLGEANPVAPNQTPEGSDNPEGRQQNRRVEITVAK